MLSDPIAALASAPGRAAVAVVRLSGVGAFAVAARVVRRFRPDRARHAILSAFVDLDGRAIDRGICVAFPAPHSYTGEDLVELTCHGGLVVPAQLLGALFAAGARPAAPGEFTRRAVLNGKLDLIQAEAVGELIDAIAPAQARAAIHQIDGGLSRRIELLRTQLLEICALLGYELDFPGEDDGPVAPGIILAQLDHAAAALRRLLQTTPAGERLRRGALVVLAGQPNTGKSSLFNALLGSQRALVTPSPGTTRDAIEADTSFHGWPIRLADTAGLRDTVELIERLGIEVSRRYLEGADLVLLCVESGRRITPAERELLAGRPTVLIRTKADLEPTDPDAEIEGVPVSVVSGEGLDLVRQVVADQVFGSEGRFPVPDLDGVLLHERHRQAMARASEELDAARPHLSPGGDSVLAAHHVRHALQALDELLGAVDVEEVLDRVFSRFCVGK